MTRLDRKQKRQGRYEEECVGCRRIRDNTGFWHKISESRMAGGLEGLRKSMCVECSRRRFPQFY